MRPRKLDPFVVAGIVVAVLAAAPAFAADDDVYTNPIGMKLKRLPAGSFIMGSEVEADEMPPRKVTLTKPFYMGTTEVTQAQYEKVMGKNPSRFKGANLPVELVAWADAVSFCEKLSKMDPKGTYRLPTEAEWEYACRAGTKTHFIWGRTSDGTDHGWFHRNSEEKTHEVGQLKPNNWGLYDMAGNVWEWCSDWYAPSYTGAKSTDPTGPTEGTLRVLRGGSFYFGRSSTRCANRRAHDPTRVDGEVGFRVVFIPD